MSERKIDEVTMDNVEILAKLALTPQERQKAMDEMEKILRKDNPIFLEHVPDTVASLCRSAMKDAKAKIGDDPVALFVNLSLPQRPERLTVVPSMMAFHGVQWDFAAETLYYGVYYTQLGELIVKYSDQSA